MKLFIGYFLGLLTAANLFPQTPEKTKSANDAWQDLSEAVRSVPLQPSGAPTPPSVTRKSAAEVKAVLAARGMKARQCVAAAKDFYTKYPTHEKAAEAKKLEVVFGLQGLIDGDTAHEIDALQLADAFRKDASANSHDRFEVAVLAENVKMRAALRGARGKNRSKEKEKVAEKLRKEFGDILQVFDYYLSIARSAEAEVAIALANKLLAWPVSSETRYEAQSILTRHALLGKKLGLKFNGMDGNAVDPEQSGGKKTLIFFWHPAAGGNAFALIDQIEASRLRDYRIVYVAVGTSSEATSIDSVKVPVPGIMCYDDPRVSVVLSELNVRSLPYMFILDAGGAVAGYGPAVELSTLMGGNVR